MRALSLLAISACAALSLVACDSKETKTYDVRVSFNSRYSAETSDEVRDFILSYDDKAEVRELELSPPVAVARVNTSDEQICEAFRDLLQTKDYVREVGCTIPNDPITSS
jgi:hypothetical protein